MKLPSKPRSPSAEHAHTPYADRPFAAAPAENAAPTPRPAHTFAQITIAPSPVVQQATTDTAPAAPEHTDAHAIAAEGTVGSGQALPYQHTIQRAFGRHRLDDARAFIGGNAAQASARLGAHAYAYGNQVAFAAPPSLHTAAHEAAHVIQQRAGVHLAGGVGRRNDPYEQHANQVADQVVRGESAEALLGQVAPSGRATTSPEPQVVQGDIGIEIELPVPIVQSNGSNIEGEVTLGRAGGVKIVTDHNVNLTGKSLANKQVACVEAVVEHVNEATPDGLQALKNRLEAVSILITELNKALRANAETKWDDFWGGPAGYKLTRNVNGGKLGQDVGYVQFTVGVAPSVVSEFLDSMEVLGAPTKGAASPIADAIETEAAVFTADVLQHAKDLPPQAARDLDGYLMLCYMQVAGLYNGMRDRTLENDGVLPPSGGVMKNNARLLPRMSPSHMFTTLDPKAQAFIATNGKHVVKALTGWMLEYRVTKEKPFAQAIVQKIKPKFRDPAGLLSVGKMKQLVDSVGDPRTAVDISHDGLYGRMAVANGPDAVSPNLKGVPVEVRHHAAMGAGRKNQMTREEWEATALIWYQHTLRYLHGEEEQRRAQNK